MAPRLDFVEDNDGDKIPPKWDSGDRQESGKKSSEKESRRYPYSDREIDRKEKQVRKSNSDEDPWRWNERVR